MTTRPHYWFPVPPSGDRKIKWWFPFVDDSGARVWDFPVNIGAGGGGGGGVSVGAVAFDGSTFLDNAALVATDNADFSIFARFNVPDWGSQTVFIANPDAYTTYLQGNGTDSLALYVGSADGSSYSGLFTPVLLTPGWHTFIASFKCDLAPSPTKSWWVSISGDGSLYIAAANGDFIYTSQDGVTWTQRTGAGSGTWYMAAVSNDGSVIAAVKSDNTVTISLDGGATWSEVIVSDAVALVAASMSADGSHIIVSDSDAGAFFYVSTDTGATWTQKGVGHGWTGAYATPDGTKLYAINTTELYRSTDGGSSFASVTVPSGPSFSGVTASADGTKIAVGTFDGSGSLFVSSNSGGSWTDMMPVAGSNWRAVVSSNGWEQLVAFDNKPGFVWTSQNAGTSWNHAVDGNNYKWVSGGISADGSKIIAGAKDDGAIVHISPDAGETWQYNRVVPNTRKVIGYIDDHRAIAGYEDHGPAFDVGMNGLRMVIGSDSFGSNLIGDVSHLWIGQGVSLITGSDIPDAARRQFVTAGNKPTDPTAWPAAPVAFYGNAADWEAQAVAQGFTITGTLTDTPDGV